MKFYVSYSLAQYEGTSDAVFDTIEQVIAFLNKHAENSDFRFTVIHGRLVTFEPTVMVKAFKRKET